MKEAIEQLEQMSADEYERELYEIRERSRLTYNTEMNEAKRKGLAAGLAEGRTKGLAEGRAEGRAEGKAEEKKEIAKKMKEKGLDIELIQELTNLTKDEINSL